MSEALGQAPSAIDVVRRGNQLTVLVFGTRTSIERRLLDAGHEDLIRQERDALRSALDRPLRRALRMALDCRSVPSVSGSHDPPSGIETLLFTVENGV